LKSSVDNPVILSIDHVGCVWPWNASINGAGVLFVDEKCGGRWTKYWRVVLAAMTDCEMSVRVCDGPPGMGPGGRDLPHPVLRVDAEQVGRMSDNNKARREKGDIVGMFALEDDYNTASSTK
jgi:hypothetical protein